MKSFTSTLFFLVLLGLVTLLSNNSSATVGDLVFNSTSESRVGHVEIDRTRNWFYIADETQGSVRIVDLASKDELDPIVFNEAVYDIALEPSANFLWVVTDNSAPHVYLVDLSTLAIAHVIPLPEHGYAIEVGDRYAYISANNSYNGVMRVDVETRQYVDTFTGGIFTYFRAMLEISPDKRRLWVANRGISPLTLAVFDISGATPALLTTSSGNLGSNGQSLALDPVHGQFVSIAAGGGNTTGYDTYVLNSGDLSVQSTLDTGPFPRSAAYHPDGARVLTAHTSGEVQLWEVATGNLIQTLTIDGEARVMAISAHGDYLAVSDNAQRFNIYQIGESPAPEGQLSGTVAGGAISELVCINHTSGQSVSATLDDVGLWDCIQQGLHVSVGDEVEARLRMMVD